MEQRSFEDPTVQRKTRIAAGISWTMPQYPITEPRTKTPPLVRETVAVNSSATQTSPDSQHGDRTLVSRPRVDSFNTPPVICNGISTSTMTENATLLAPTCEKISKHFLGKMEVITSMPVIARGFRLAVNGLLDAGYEFRAIRVITS